MNYPHRIRLAGPWQCRPLIRTRLDSEGDIEDVPGDVPSAGRVRIPGRWDFGSPFNGRVRYTRFFQSPRSIDYYERVWITFEAVDYFADVWCNGTQLGRHAGAFDPFEFEITSLLRPRNELVVEVELPESDGRTNRVMLRDSPVCETSNGGIWGEVALEIRRESFLRAARNWATFEADTFILHFAGEIGGTPDRELEIYGLLNGETVIYERISVGQDSYHFTTPVEDVYLWNPAGQSGQPVYEISTELVDVGSRLDRVDGLQAFRKIRHCDDANVVFVNEKEFNGAEIRPLLEPLARSEFWDEAVRRGKFYWLQLPIWGVPEPTSAHRQLATMIEHLRSHPAILGWVIPRGDGSEDEFGRIKAVVHALDPTRPVRIIG